VKEALAALDQQHFDLLFVYLKLPDGPADDVYDAAKKIDPAADYRYHRLFQQRDARSDFGKRADYGFEKAAASGPAAPDRADSRPQRSREGGITRSRFCCGRTAPLPIG
jgi:hypothetical protein